VRDYQQQINDLEEKAKKIVGTHSLNFGGFFFWL
jgi:hypothetical protein